MGPSHFLELLLLSQAMATMAMDMAMVDMVTMDTMARDLLMPSQVMVTMVMDMDMVMDMVMDMDTMDKYQSFFECSLEFSTNEVGPHVGFSHYEKFSECSINYFFNFLLK